MLPKIPDVWIIEDDFGTKSEFETDFYADVRIMSGEHISDMMANHPEIVSRWCTISELCADYAVRLKQELGRVEAHLDMIVRASFAEANQKMTEAKVGHAIITRKEFVDAQDKLNAANLQAGLAKAAKEGIIQRKDMLVGIGASYRAEGQSTVYTKSL